MTFATLRALHAVIGSAIDEIERVYRERSQGGSLEYPSLDEPYYHAAHHTSDEELAEALKGDPSVAVASKKIVAACAQLSITVNKPWSGLMEDMLWAQFSSAIRFLEAANIVEILREAGPGGLHAREILRLVLELRTNSKTAGPPEVQVVPLTSSHLSHILRLLETGHYLREVKPDVFANNRASSYIDSGKTVAQLREAPEKKYNDTNGVAAYTGRVGDDSLKYIIWLVEWALPEKWHAIARGTNTNVDVDHRAPPPELGQLQPPGPTGTEGAIPRFAAPFNIAYNTHLGVFRWLELPENEHRLVRFGHGMVGTRQCETENEILQGFSWEDLPQDSVLVDVGGGIGAQAIIVADAHPHLRVVVEDREQVVSTALSLGLRSLPAFGPVDVPAVFLLRAILHNWKDEDCKRKVILTRLRAAAGPHTKLLIGDMLLQHACADEQEYAAADGSAMTFPFITRDSPLLPNLGVANILGYFTDLMMMGMFDAKERTVDEMTALTLSAGWRIVEVRRTPGSIWGYTTAIPV